MTTTLLVGEAVVDGTLETITRSDIAGSWITDGFRAGQTIDITGFTNSENNVVGFPVVSVTATVLKLDANLISETNTSVVTLQITDTSLSSRSQTTMGITIEELRAANGSSVTPSVSFKNQPDMGFYLKRQDNLVPIPGNHLHFAIDGIRALRILRGGTIRVNGGYENKVLIGNDLPNKRYVDTWNINTQTGTSYTPIFDSATFVDGDINKVVTLDNPSPITLEVPENATWDFPIGSRITFIQQGAGTVTFSPESGTVTIQSLGGGLAITGQFGVATLIKIDTDTWNLSGDI